MNLENLFKKIDSHLPPGAILLLKNQWAPDIKFHISAPRKSKLGDFRPAWNGEPASITINNDLNQYAFLVTLLHELAHYYTWKTFGQKADPHGIEWKHIFRKLLLPHLVQKMFPPEIQKALDQYMEKTTASSCTHPPLNKALRLYDDQQWMLVDELPAKALFILKGLPHQVFQKGSKMRTRFKCLEVKTKKEFWVNAMAEVAMYQGQLD